MSNDTKGNIEVLYTEQIKDTYKSNVLQLNPLMAKCFPELMPLLKVGDTWIENFGNGRKMIVKGFTYRNCSSGRIVCYVLETTEAHKSIYHYPCWALDKSLEEGPPPEPPLDYGKADQTANRYITEEPKIIFPDKNCVNLSKCYKELKKRYNKAIDLLSLQSKIIPQAESDEVELKKLENDVGLFLGEDFNLHVINGLHND